MKRFLFLSILLLSLSCIGSGKICAQSSNCPDPLCTVSWIDRSLTTYCQPSGCKLDIDYATRTCPTNDFEVRIN